LVVDEYKPYAQLRSLYGWPAPEDPNGSRDDELAGRELIAAPPSAERDDCSAAESATADRLRVSLMTRRATAASGRSV
jgi:hypothetical protein